MRSVAGWLLVAAVAGCAGPSPLAEYFQPDQYTVRRGDTVYSIAWRYQLDHLDLIRWNGLSAPFPIWPGQKLRLTPPPVTRAQGAAQPPVPAQGASSAADPGQQPRPAPAQEAPVEAGGEPPLWRWPTGGTVVADFDRQDSHRRGLDIAGDLGQPVFAAAAGRVVYSGNGLPAYGNLIIVRHDDVYLSAYAHNRELLVGEGEMVDQGQRIATMGTADDRRPLLHFEIRKNGRPVDPMRLLPAR